MNRSTPGLPVYHQLPEFTQIHHVYRVIDAIQASHPLSSPSPPAPNPSQHQSLYQFCNLGRTKTTVPKGDTNENLISLIEAQKDLEQRHQGLLKVRLK